MNRNIQDVLTDLCNGGLLTQEATKPYGIVEKDERRYKVPDRNLAFLRWHEFIVYDVDTDSWKITPQGSAYLETQK